MTTGSADFSAQPVSRASALFRILCRDKARGACAGLKSTLPVVVLSASMVAHSQQSSATIGIFDLKAIHAVPLDPEVLGKAKDGDVNIERVRFTVLPGVRMMATITYKDGAKGAPGYQFVENFPVNPLIAEAKAGFFGFVITPPTGNKDPKKMESVGGPVYGYPFNFNAQFLPDKTNSYIYQTTVALIRGLDYLETRPEVNVSHTVITSYSWASTMVGLLHALDDRPAGYVIFHSPGYYVDEQGLSGGKPVILNGTGMNSIALTRKEYEMYCPAAYAQYGSKPIYDGTALDDSYTRLDAAMEMYKNLKSPKAFAYAPNRHHAATSRDELSGYQWWVSSWLFGGDKPSTVGEGTVKSADGKLTYTCAVDSKVPLTHSELLISYGKAGNWLGRTWHRLPMVKQGESYTCEIPIYDPQIPFYAAAQIETQKFGAIANGIQFVEPQAQGISKSNTGYPDVLFDPSQKDDLYIRVGSVEWSPDGPDGHGSAIVTPGPEGTITFQNVDGEFWTGRRSLSIWLKGDGKPGPIRAYLALEPNYYLEVGRKNYATIDLVPTGATFTAGWSEYSIPLSKVPNLNLMSTLFLDSQKRKLQIGPITLKS